MPSPKDGIRWDWIEVQWKSGVLSNHAIADAHNREFGVTISEGTIRHRVNKYGWIRDISEAVRNETRRKLAEGATTGEIQVVAQNATCVTSDVAQITQRVTLDEVAAIDRESDRAAEVVKMHRYHAQRLQKLASSLEAYAAAMLPVDDDGNPTRVYDAGEIKDISSAVANVAAARARAVELERKAYSLDAENQGTLGQVSALELLRGYLNGDDQDA